MCPVKIIFFTEYSLKVCFLTKNVLNIALADLGGSKNAQKSTFSNVNENYINVKGLTGYFR